MDFLSKLHPVHGLDQMNILHYIFYFIGLQPADHMDAKISAEKRCFFPDFLNMVFTDVRKQLRVQILYHGDRMGFGDSDNLWQGITAFRSIFHIPADSVQTFNIEFIHVPYPLNWPGAGSCLRPVCLPEQG